MADAFPELDGAVDVVVSNPPYIPAGALIRDPEVADHDPALALWSGAGRPRRGPGRRAGRPRLLRPGGLVVVEHADLQGGGAGRVLPRRPAGPTWRDHHDLAGRDRFVTAVRRRTARPTDHGRAMRGGRGSAAVRHRPTPVERPTRGLDAGRRRRPPRRARGAADRHRLRPRRRRLLPRRRWPTCSRPRAAAGTCRCRCWSAPAHPRRHRDRPRRTAARPGRGVLAGRAHRSCASASRRCSGTSATPRHRRRPDAAAPGGHRAARRDRADGASAAPTVTAPAGRRPATRRSSSSARRSAVYLDGGPSGDPSRPRSSTSPGDARGCCGPARCPWRRCARSYRRPERRAVQ